MRKVETISKIYTVILHGDGSYFQDYDKGGIAYFIDLRGLSWIPQENRVITGGKAYRNTNASRMELFAQIEAIKYLRDNLINEQLKHYREKVNDDPLLLRIICHCDDINLVRLLRKRIITNKVVKVTSKKPS